MDYVKQSQVIDSIYVIRVKTNQSYSCIKFTLNNISMMNCDRAFLKEQRRFVFSSTPNDVSKFCEQRLLIRNESYWALFKRQKVNKKANSQRIGKVGK